MLEEGLGGGVRRGTEVLENAGVGDHDVEVRDVVGGLEEGDHFAGGGRGGRVVLEDKDLAVGADWEGGEGLSGG